MSQFSRNLTHYLFVNHIFLILRMNASKQCQCHLNKSICQINRNTQLQNGCNAIWKVLIFTSKWRDFLEKTDCLWMYHICHLITMQCGIEKLNNASKMLCYLTTQYAPHIYCVRFIGLPRVSFQSKWYITHRFNHWEGEARYLKFKMVQVMSKKW